MRLPTLVLRSLKFYWRTHFGVLAGAAVAVAVLTSALLVGDSIRFSLRQSAMERLGETQVAMNTPGRWFRHQLADELAERLGAPAAAVLALDGSAKSDTADSTIARVQVLGCDGHFWRLGRTADLTAALAGDQAVINQALAERLGLSAGDALLVRVEKPSAIPRDAPLSVTADARLALRLTVAAVVDANRFGGFGLQANQLGALNVYLPRGRLQRLVGLARKANLLLIGGDDTSAESAQQALRDCWRLADAQLQLRDIPGRGKVELRSERIFLDAPVVAAAATLGRATGVLTYFVNSLSSGENRTPYSMVTAMGPLGEGSPSPTIIPADMADGDILINDWLAKDLKAGPGERIELEYFVLRPMRKLETRRAMFRVRDVVPLAGPAADPTLMPAFPGLAESDTCRDWTPGIPIDLDRIRPADERYWEQHRGTPKAFLTLDAGRRIWGNRFGDLTAVRFDAEDTTPEQLAAALRSRIDPSEVGLFFQPVRKLAAAASDQALDFGQLFLGLSAFVIVAAIVLMAMLFVFGIQQRAGQLGALLAMGFSPRRINALLLTEGALLAVAGAAIGAVGAAVYARITLWALATIWRGAVAGSAIHYFGSTKTFLVGPLAGAAVALAAMWLTLRRLSRLSPRQLLAGETTLTGGPRRTQRQQRRAWFAVAALPMVAAIGIIVWATFAGQRAAAGAFFSSGALLLVGGILACRGLLASTRQRTAGRWTLQQLAINNSSRRIGRSLAVVAMLASGCFLTISIGAFHLPPPADPSRRDSGTGGFALMVTTSVPVFEDLNEPKTRSRYGLDRTDAAKMSIVSLRTRRGDDASCLNLNRAQRPMLYGVAPEQLRSRGAFRFLDAEGADGTAHGWALLDRPLPDQAIPAIGDKATVVWALGKNLGETVEYTDERGRPIKLRIVAVLADSILQGSLLIGETQFTDLFPSESGYRAFLVDASPDSTPQVAGDLARALEDAGVDVATSGERLAAFNAVQNTYLVIFQAMGGLGLILGSVALAVVVGRNVLERRGELALMRAVGFTRARLGWMLLLEHWGLLACGLACGVLAAAVAILPALRTSGTELPWALLGAILAAVTASGVGWIALATHLALRGEILDALRTE